MPKEACGVILADGTVARLDNISDTPEDSYQFDPREQLEYWHGDVDVIAIWHSHPTTTGVPSLGDIHHWTEPDMLCVIAGTDGVGVWKIEDGRAILQP